MNKVFDAIVVGSGHAGVEAAYVLAKLGKRTLLLTLSQDAISFMACNPNVGGTAKGHLVKELDALGGLMGEIADVAAIQTRMLNLSNGPAVRSLRFQVDKSLYHRKMKQRLETTPGLTIVQGESVALIVSNGHVRGIKTAMGAEFLADAVVIATGVYLNSKIITGSYSKLSGPNGFSRSEALSDNLKALGIVLHRFKTGTPPRVAGKTIDYSKMEEQCGDNNMPTFSVITKGEVDNSAKCYLTYTNPDTHTIILSNLDRAPLYNGSIEGTGPRYCPSIEDKVVRFKDKSRHQLFIEPEGNDTDEKYVQGLSTSLPYDIQEMVISTIPGLENATITRYGYAIEYDCIDPLELTPYLAIKKIKGLFSAGQINGSSGYEEAAVQGLMAGINAALYIDAREPFVLRRDEAYIGVLIDDLTTNGTTEPYRMMTSRAEHRLYLRQDNAYFRLTKRGREVGLVDDVRYNEYLKKESELARLTEYAKLRHAPETLKSLFDEAKSNEPKTALNLAEILRRTEIT
ncbi:MAG: tRNA uridine-5-carboxymethylaminomethyl(34) synthesis enzyme MnmG, partial [Christensenellaceae bacterium]|nr:tRNA uridine-5-carboxymethylaminomethyl(34) synthesis enzyme MnmG [Christensenellaceae bacterium]